MQGVHAELAACALLTLPDVTDQRPCHAVCRFESNSICIAFCTAFRCFQHSSQIPLAV